MYKLPPDISLSFLAERTLIQVCIGMHELILHFDNDISITVCSSIGLEGQSGQITEYVDFRQAAMPLCSLIGEAITSAQNAGNGVLALQFNGKSLHFYDDSDDYESYIIEYEGRCIVV